MTRLPVLIIVGVLAAPQVSSACRWFGTQLECEIGANRVVIGTQAAEAPTYARSFSIRSFHGDSGLPDDPAASGLRRPFEIEIKNFSADPSRRIGNETYCR